LYFDAQQPDGTLLVGYFMHMRLAWTHGGEAMVLFFPRAGAAWRRSFHVPGRSIAVAADKTQARFAGGELAHGGGTGRMDFAASDVSLAMRYTAAAPVWLPGGTGQLYAARQRSLRWLVPIPRAQVSAELRIGAQRIAVDGLGYSDFVQTTIPPRKLPLEQLLWGRALGDDGALIWTRLLLSGAGEQAICRGWTWQRGNSAREHAELDYRVTRWATCEPLQGVYPDEAQLVFGADDALALDSTRLLLGERVADLPRFASRLQRGLYRRLTGDPVEYKLLSRARRDGRTALLAAHELVHSGRPRRAG
jgi:hypothetical protein